MNILSVARGHNASTTLLVDGEIKFYVEEERLTRFKYDGAPFAGIIEALKHVDSLDYLIINHTQPDTNKVDYTAESAYVSLVRKILRDKPHDTTFKVIQQSDIHHKLHAAAGFYNSGFESAACVIADGAGSFLEADKVSEVIFEFETVFHASYPNEFEQKYKHNGTEARVGYIPIREDSILTEYPGLTKAYEAVTQFVGFPPIEAGKTMGLAPYGKPNPDLPKIFTEDGWVDRNVIVPTYPNGAYVNYARYPILAEDYMNQREGEYTQIQKDMAYAIQKETQEAMIRLIRLAHERTGEKNIVICGGYGLNCVANYEYLKEFPDLNIYCEPISHDGGTSIGAAKLLWAQLTDQKEPKKQESVYYGLQYDPETYSEAFKDHEVVDATYEDVANLLVDGKIVTIFQGRSEGGPRALGNRSILFDPRIKNGKDIVNEVKHREFFRPFAGSILEEDVHEWFDLQGRPNSPHMMYAVDCQPGVEEKIPSIIHVDGTCRIQTVNKEQNEHYYNLISKFKELTGTPVVFNTSFNLGGEPLVETIDDAVRTIENSDLNYLYMPEIGKLLKFEGNLSKEDE